MSGYPVLSTRSNFAPSYLCLSPPLSSTSTARVAKLSMPGRLFRPLQLSETSWQLASKGRLVIPRNAFENLSVGHKSSRAFLQLGKAKRSFVTSLRRLVSASRRHKYNRESIFILVGVSGKAPLSRGRSSHGGGRGNHLNWNRGQVGARW